MASSHACAQNAVRGRIGIGRLMTVLTPHSSRELIDALAEGPSALITLLNQTILSLNGFTAVTLLACDPAEHFTRRIGTSDPGIFPEGAAERIVDSAWHRRIFNEKAPVIANTPDEMTQFYPEAADLEAFGFGAIISAPIVLNGQVRGILNILGERDVLTSERLRETENLIPITALVFALADTSGR